MFTFGCKSYYWNLWKVKDFCRDNKYHETHDCYLLARATYFKKLRSHQYTQRYLVFCPGLLNSIIWTFQKELKIRIKNALLALVLMTLTLKNADAYVSVTFSAFFPFILMGNAMIIVPSLSIKSFWSRGQFTDVQ